MILKRCVNKRVYVCVRVISRLVRMQGGSRARQKVRGRVTRVAAGVFIRAKLRAEASYVVCQINCLKPCIKLTGLQKIRQTEDEVPE